MEDTELSRPQRRAEARGEDHTTGTPDEGPAARGFVDGQLVDHFRVIRHIDSGGMSDVYQARDTKLGRKVALKVVRRGLGSADALERFLFEARATAQFNHPHITTIYAVGEVHGYPYVALEYLEGQSLRQRMEQERPAVAEVLRIGLAIAEALREAHRRAILHRDLKPENVMLPLDGRLRVVDFGLAKVIPEALTNESVDCTPPEILDTTPGGLDSDPKDVCGTPAYMAPEQWRQHGITGAADIWALGVLLHELVFGERPYGRQKPMQLALQVCDSEPVPVREPEPGVPPALVSLIRQCLDKDPAARPRASHVIERLRELQASERGRVDKSAPPFRGLQPFDERHHHLFFGREVEIAAFLERLRNKPIVPVIGPSGAGKSSFVQAGVIPRLQERGALLLLRIRPGADPFRTLAARLLSREQDPAGESDVTSYLSVGAPLPTQPTAGVTRPQEARDPEASPDPVPPDTHDPPPGPPAQEQRDREIARLAEQLYAEPRLLNVRLHRLAERTRRLVVLFVDQLEELSTLVTEDDRRRRFMEAVCRAVDDEQMPVRVILTLREEFLGRLAEGPGARTAFSQIVLLRAPGPVALQKMLQRPLSLLGYDFDDPTLAQEMVREVAGEASCLPLLQFAGHQLWERRDRENRLLRRADYARMGGVAGALAQHADGVLTGLSAQDVQLARTLLLRLVTVESTRRVLPQRRLLEGLDPGAEQVLQRLAHARLINVKRDLSGADAELELAHESLIASWTRLRRWIEESREELVLLAELEQAAELWEKRGERADEVWQGSALADAARALAHATADVPAGVQRFLLAGQRRARRHQRRRRLQLGAGFVGLAAVAVVAILIALTLSSQKQALEQERARTEGQRVEALLESARGALVRGRPLEARAKLRMTLESADSATARILWWRLASEPLQWARTLGAATFGVAFSPAGRHLAVASADGNVYLFDVLTSTGHKVLRGHTSDLRAVAFSPDGTLLASSGFDRTVRIWRVATGKTLHVLRDHTSLVGGVAFSPDGRLLASASRDRTVRLWRVSTGAVQRVLRGHTGGVWTVRFSPDGSQLASAGDDRVIRLWDVATGQPRGRFAGHKAEVHDVRFSPDGRLLASASWDGTIGLWRLRPGARPRMLPGKGGEIWRVAFHPDGETLASTGGDGRLRLWDVATGRLKRTLAGHRGDSRGVTYSPDGRLLASTGADKTVRLWRPAGTAPTATGRGHRHEVLGVAFSPDSKRLASASKDQTIRLWSLRTGRQLRVLRGHRHDVSSVAFSPDGRRLASTSGDGSLRLWDASSGAPLRVHMGQLGRVEDLSFRPDGAQVAALVRNRIRLWDVASGRLLRELTAPGAVLGAADVVFNSDGTLLAAAGRDRVIRAWDAVSGELRHAFRGHTDVAYAVTFAPGSAALISGSYDGTIRTWPLDGKSPPRVLKVAGSVEKIAFHPRGRRLGYSTTDDDGVGYLVGLADGARVPLEGHHGGLNRLAFSPDGRWVATAGQDGSVRTWRARSGRPHWRAPALLASPPRLVTHQGWIRLDSSDRGTAAHHGQASPPGGGLATTRWERAVQQRGRYALAAPGGGLLCLRTLDDHLELWDTRRDRRLHRRPTPGVRRVVAHPSGCAVLDARGRVRLVQRSGVDRRLLRTGGTALAWGDGVLLVATRRGVRSFAPSGREGTPYPSDQGVTAMLATERWLALGYADGNVERVSRKTRRRVGAFTLQSVPSSPVLRLLQGPQRTLIAGFADGTVGLWSGRTGVLLKRARLHGPVVHLRSVGHRLYAATDLGSYLVWDLSTLNVSWCALLRQIWRRVPVGWRAGRPVRRGPPAGHRCHR